MTFTNLTTTVEKTNPKMQSLMLSSGKAQKAFAPELDEALIRLVQAVRSTGDESDMDALGSVLAYMESLESSQSQPKGSTKGIWLQEPATITL